MKEIIETVKNKSDGFTKEVKTRTIGYILGAFGLVTGLAWNEAIKSLINYLFPLDKNSLVAQFVYAVVLTVVLVVVSILVVRFARKEE